MRGLICILAVVFVLFAVSSAEAGNRGRRIGQRSVGGFGGHCGVGANGFGGVRGFGYGSRGLDIQSPFFGFRLR